jgi:imidazolonepropionase-like amidohydrolase
MHAATFFDGEAWREGVLDVVDGRMLLRTDIPTEGLPRVDGVVTGTFTDHHVHLQLVDPSGLADSALGRVIDLGANVDEISRLAAVVHSSASSEPETLSAPATLSAPGSEEVRTGSAGDGVQVEFAGAFLTAPGGYPTDRIWAPEGSFREIADIEQAAAAIDEMADAGARWIKVASNTVAGPVFGDELFRAVVALAAGRGLPVVAHAEGPTEAQRVARIGVARLAHAPFTARLDDDEIALQAASVSWISTLAIHDPPERAVAVDNVRRFQTAGGTVLYGTDMGNGPTPVGLNPGELAALQEAGIQGTALLRALAPLDPLGTGTLDAGTLDTGTLSTGTLLFFPGASPATADPLRARRLTAADLKV